MIPTMTQADEDVWDGEVGYINSALIEKYVGDVLAPIYYLAGPPAMTNAMREVLGNLNVDSDYIKSEEFSGY